ncbi:hypothetical protein PC9H_004030 [Pleurotus ostreatus]|uniref:Dienelactone hydrolase domain-containing protein n=1 Tax=Pleurotus ostreatus TaxID=5322 RepID=A0A8H7DUG1_PLEOS|nr:uncharacterized protein PC9H_004030 [Pleurotus ostreatus]KAF7437194.1 hypothetical protein PC9H_004030 [Pleurotus ostreatus]
MLSRLRLLAHQLNKAKMTTASTTVHNTNKACCSIPPVIDHDYTPKGKFTSHGDFQKVYVTGPDESDNAIVCVFDIFGFFPQTQQGADIIATALKTKVYMPDFFEPDSAFPIDGFPPKSDADKQALQDFFGGPANPQRTKEKLEAFGKLLKNDGAKRLGVYGFCWGGKVVVISSGEGTPFDASSIVHPAMLSADDASKLTVPLAIYISQDEPVDEYTKIVDILSKKPFSAQCDSKNYDYMFHGWAAARGNLKNEDNRKAYEEVYGKLVNYFQNTLGAKSML